MLHLAANDYMRLSLLKHLIVAVLIVGTIIGCISIHNVAINRPYGMYQDMVTSMVMRRLVLHPNNTFTYVFSGHMMYDTSAGSFQVMKDTVFFEYHYNHYDSIYKCYEVLNQPVPLFVAISDHSRFRPGQLLWKGKRLYSIHNGQISEVFMEWVR